MMSVQQTSVTKSDYDDVRERARVPVLDVGDGVARRRPAVAPDPPPENAVVAVDGRAGHAPPVRDGAQPEGPRERGEERVAPVVGVRHRPRVEARPVVVAEAAVGLVDVLADALGRGRARVPALAGHGGVVVRVRDADLAPDRREARRVGAAGVEAGEGVAELPVAAVERQVLRPAEARVARVELRGAVGPPVDERVAVEDADELGRARLPVARVADVPARDGRRARDVLDHGERVRELADVEERHGHARGLDDAAVRRALRLEERRARALAGVEARELLRALGVAARRQGPDARDDGLPDPVREDGVGREVRRHVDGAVRGDVEVEAEDRGAHRAVLDPVLGPEALELEVDDEDEQDHVAEEACEGAVAEEHRVVALEAAVHGPHDGARVPAGLGVRRFAEDALEVLGPADAALLACPMLDIVVVATLAVALVVFRRMMEARQGGEHASRTGRGVAGRFHEAGGARTQCEAGGARTLSRGGARTLSRGWRRAARSCGGDASFVKCPTLCPTFSILPRGISSSRKVSRSPDLSPAGER